MFLFFYFSFMKKIYVLFIISSLTIFSCSKECKICVFQELDAQGNVLSETSSEEKCGDELESAENFKGITVSGSARFKCE